MDLDNNSLAGALLGLVTVVGGSFLWLRKWLSKDSVDRAGDGATLSVIKMLQAQLDRERDYSREVTASLNEAHRQMEGMRQQISELTDQVRELQAEVRTLRGPSSQ